MQLSDETLRDGHLLDGSALADTIRTRPGHFDPRRWVAMFRQLTELKLVDKPINPLGVHTMQSLSK